METESSFQPLQDFLKSFGVSGWKTGRFPCQKGDSAGVSLAVLLFVKPWAELVGVLLSQSDVWSRT